MARRFLTGNRWANTFILLATIAIMWSCLSPVFIRPGFPRRHTICLTNLQKLSTALEMYIQDHHRYPGAHWTTALSAYHKKRQDYHCPEDTFPQDKGAISYGYSGLLVQPDSLGISSELMIAPNETVAFADATPRRSWDTGGGLLWVDAEIDPRHSGAMVAYCDGHVKYVPGKRVDFSDLLSPLSRAVVQAPALGLVDYYGGGIEAVNVSPTAHSITVGGDSAALPLVMAAAQLWEAKGGRWLSQGFTGVGDPAVAKVRAGKHYVWADASGSSRGQVIGYDVLLIIVARNSKISFDTSLTANEGMPVEEVVSVFGGSSVRGVQQVYTYPSTHGNRRFFTGKLRAWGAVAGKEFSPGAITVTDDRAMVEKVAADPYGIGYCSSAIADLDKVAVVALQHKGITSFWPNNNVKYRTIRPDTAADCPHLLLRPLRIEVGGDGARLADIFTQAGFLDGPLYRASYFRP